MFLESLGATTPQAHRHADRRSLDNYHSYASTWDPTPKYIPTQMGIAPVTSLRISNRGLQVLWKFQITQVGVASNSVRRDCAE